MQLLTVLSSWSTGVDHVSEAADPVWLWTAEGWTESSVTLLLYLSLSRPALIFPC